MTKRMLLPVSLLVLGGAAVTVAGYASQRGAAGSAIEASGPMPAIDRPALGGGRVTPSLYRGKVVLVNFWATWCGPCRREQPGLERLWREMRDDGVRFIGVNFKDDRAAALAYLEEFDVTYPSVEDRDGLLAYRFGVPYLPATIIADRAGEMRYRLVGAQTETALRRYLRRLSSS